MKVHRSISLVEAEELIDIVLELADDIDADPELRAPIAVSVHDIFGDQLASKRMDEASGRTIKLAALKGRQAALGGTDTVNASFEWKQTGEHIENGEWAEKPANVHRTDDNFRTIDPNYTSFAGGVAIFDNLDMLIGGIGISGRSQLDDHDLAERTVLRWCSKHGPAPMGIDHPE